MSDPMKPTMSSPMGVSSAMSESDPAQRSQAMIAHLLGILGILGTGIYYLIKRNDPTAGPFVRDQMKEVFNFEVVVFAAYIALMIAAVVLAMISPKLVLLVSLADLVLFVGNIALVVMAGMKANKGEAARYPFKFSLLK